MRINTFGDVNKYKMLGCIMEKMEFLSKPQRQYVSSLINELNEILKNVNSISNVKLKKYLLKLIHDDYIHKIDNMVSNYELILITHLKNFINARIKNQINLVN